jgi:HSP20 family protein
MYKVSSSVHFVKRSPVADPSESPVRAHWTPNTDLYVTEEGLVIKVEMAGMKSDDLEITVEENKLRISGQRPDGCRPPKCKFIVMEINYGPFETVVEVPQGYDLAQARAVYLNGFLRIDIPLAQRSSRKVKVS